MHLYDRPYTRIRAGRYICRGTTRTGFAPSHYSNPRANHSTRHAVFLCTGRVFSPVRSEKKPNRTGTFESENRILFSTGYVYCSHSFQPVVSIRSSVLKTNLPNSFHRNYDVGSLARLVFLLLPGVRTKMKQQTKPKNVDLQNECFTPCTCRTMYFCMRR